MNLPLSFTDELVLEAIVAICFVHVTNVFRLNLHIVVAWMSKNSPFETGTISEIWVNGTGLAYNRLVYKRTPNHFCETSYVDLLVTFSEKGFKRTCTMETCFQRIGCNGSSRTANCLLTRAMRYSNYKKLYIRNIKQWSPKSLNFNLIDFCDNYGNFYGILKVCFYIKAIY